MVLNATFNNICITQMYIVEVSFIGGGTRRKPPGADPEGGPPGARPPPKIGKNIIFWRKNVIFHTKYPKNFRASLRNWKN
jgi:hypothetical protein